MVAYTGIETISNMAEEAKDYGKTIPRGIGLVVGAVAVIYTFLPAVALSAMPVKDGETLLALPKEEGGYADDPVLGVVENMELGSFAGRGGDLRRHPRRHDPLHRNQRRASSACHGSATRWGSTASCPSCCECSIRASARPTSRSRVFSAVACVAILPGQADFLGVIYAFGAMLSFTIAHVAVVTLRVKRPDVERPWKGPGNFRIRGHELPPYSVLGGLGTGIALSWPPCSTCACSCRASAGWRSGSRLYVIYRRRQGLSLTETHKVVMPKPAVEHEVEYESVLVAFEDDHYSPEAVSTAVRLAARRRRGIHVLVTITVPPNSPIDAAMPEQEAKAASIIDSARVRGGRRVTGHWEKVRPGQAGRRVVEEAKEIRARAVVMPLPPRRAGRVALRAYAGDRAQRAALPGDHRFLAEGHAVRTAYGASTRVLSVLLFLVGVAMVVSALARGGGPLALGVVLGTLLALLGAGRFWLAGVHGDGHGDER